MEIDLGNIGVDEPVPPPLPVASEAPPLPPPPQCITNVVELCNIQELTIRGFIANSEDAVLLAYKFCLLDGGLACCWRSKFQTENAKLDGLFPFAVCLSFKAEKFVQVL